MTERVYHIDNGKIHEGALDHDVRMIVENEVLNFLWKFGITHDEAADSIRRVLEEIETERR